MSTKPNQKPNVSPLSETEARNLLQSHYDRLEAMSTSGWRVVHQRLQNCVTVSTRHLDLPDGTPAPKSAPILVKGECIVKNCAPKEFFDIVDHDDIAVQQKFDPKLIVLQTKKIYNEKERDDVSVYRVAFESPTSLVSNRDFVFVRDVKRKDNESFICNLSCSVRETVDWPLERHFVRGHIHFSYWQLEVSPFNANDMKVTYINCVDLCGWIPTVILNLLSNDQPLVIQKIAKLLNKELEPMPPAH